MYELVQVSDTCFYIQSPAKIGIVLTEGDQVCLIDSGNNKDAGKKIKKILDANGWTLKAIYNTHSHADHIGGNQYLQNQTGCPIYAAGIERDFTEHPILEPALLYGANPPKELRHKFLMAKGSDVISLKEEHLPSNLQMFPLPGHCWDMVGFRSQDGIIYLADCLSSKETLEKYQVSFLVDVGAYLDTLEAIRGMEAKLFIPSHADPTDDIAPLAQYNIQKVHEVADAVEEICVQPRSFEAILQKVFECFGLTMTFEQHALVGSTVRSYITWLMEQGRLQAEIEDNKICYRQRD